MASSEDNHGLRELLGEEVFQDYFGENDESSTSTSASRVSSTELKKASKEELERLISKTENTNTKITTQTWMNRLNSWRETRNITQELHEIPLEELDKVLQRFYAELMKGNGTEYEPESLRVMIACLLRDHGATHSILKDKCFETSRKTLEGKAIELRQHGKGKQM